jgi:hypothetical protein
VAGNREIAAAVVSILQQDDGLRGQPAVEIARTLNVSKPTVDRARALLRSGNTDLIESVKAGRMSLLSAWSQLGDRPAAEASKKPSGPTWPCPHCGDPIEVPEAALAVATLLDDPPSDVPPEELAAVKEMFEEKYPGLLHELGRQWMAMMLRSLSAAAALERDER